MRNALIVFRFQFLHCIVQEEIDQDGIDPVRLLGLFVNPSGLTRALNRIVFTRPGDTFPAGCPDLWMPLLDFTLDQLHAPDTCSTEFDLPVRTRCDGFETADVRFQGRRVT